MSNPRRILALVVYFAALGTPLSAAFRIFNPTEHEATATIACGAASRALSIGAGAIVDTDDDVSCRVTVPEGITVIETQGSVQRLVPRTEDVSCSQSVAVSLPLFGCRLGNASASVTPVDGATYSWTVTGGTIISGNGTPRVVLSLGDNANAQVSVSISHGQCSTPGQGVIALHEAFAVKATTDAGRALEPMTIRWNFTGGEPVSQTLSGTDFPEPITLGRDARSYTYTPTVAGAKEAVIAATSAPPVVVSRRRATGGSRDGATTCTAAVTAANYHVEECAKPGFNIHAPKSVVGGATFEARAEGNATKVTWTIVNGSPSTWVGPTVTIHAGDSGTVQISAVGEKDPCKSTATDSLSVEIVKQLSCDRPTAKVSAGKVVTCGGGTVEASFEGTPPFNGKWSDGIVFNTTDYHLTRNVTAAGTYTITQFADSVCDGTSSGSASFASFGASAAISAKNSCANEKVTVAFTGKPPFTGRWSDNVSFDTSEMTLTRTAPDPSAFTIPGTPLDILYFYDANDCRGSVTGAYEVHEVTKVYVSSWNWPAYPSMDCSSHPSPDGYGNGVLLKADFQWGTLPLTAVWSDGVTTTEEHWPIWRTVDPQETTTYTVVSAHDKYCQSEIVQPSVTIWVSQRPEIVIPNLTDEEMFGICSGTSKKATLAVPLKAGTTVTWGAENATITSGQGTDTITFVPGQNGEAKLTCAFSFNDKRCPTSNSKTFNVLGTPPAPIVSFDPPVIKPGGSSTITYKYGLNGGGGYLSTSRLGDEIVPIGQTCTPPPDNVCKALFTDKKGVGTNTITVHQKFRCTNDENTGSATITIAQ